MEAEAEVEAVDSENLESEAEAEAVDFENLEAEAVKIYAVYVIRKAKEDRRSVEWHLHRKVCLLVRPSIRELS